MVMAEGCYPAGCILLSVCVCCFAGKASPNIRGALPALPVRLQADRGQEPCLLHSLKRPLSTGALLCSARGICDARQSLCRIVCVLMGCQRLQAQLIAAQNATQNGVTNIVCWTKCMTMLTGAVLLQSCKGVVMCIHGQEVTRVQAVLV